MKENYGSLSLPVFINIGWFCYFCITDFLYITLDYNRKLKKKKPLVFIKSNFLI